MLKRLFYEVLGTEPGQYLLQLRMQSAESLLAAGARSLPEIAEAVGFGDQSALTGRQERKSSAAYCPTSLDSAGDTGFAITGLHP